MLIVKILTPGKQRDTPWPLASGMYSTKRTSGLQQIDSLGMDFDGLGMNVFRIQPVFYCLALPESEAICTAP